jgi:hypothetical protein
MPAKVQQVRFRCSEPMNSTLSEFQRHFNFENRRFVNCAPAAGSPC